MKSPSTSSRMHPCISLSNCCPGAGGEVLKKLQHLSMRLCAVLDVLERQDLCYMSCLRTVLACSWHCQQGQLFCACADALDPQVPELALGIRQDGASMRGHFCCRCRYTHVLKTDDDCYIRYPALAATLRQPDIAGPDEGTSQMQMTGVYKGAGSPLLCMQSVL